MTHILGKRLSRIKRILQGNISALSTPKPVFYTSNNFNASLNPLSDPRSHTLNDVGLFYEIDNSLALDCLFKEARLNREFYEQCITFDKTYIMIRKPAVEIINFLNQTNYDYPINKYVLYGKRGHGVSMTILHLIHYAYVSDWLIVHVPDFIYWLTTLTERVKSTTKEGLLDLPALGSAWLSHFKNQNFKLLNKFDVRLENDYTWNIQEENKKGESLLGLVDHGIARGKYSCDVIDALLEEVKLLSKKGIVKTLVAIDNYSAIFHPGKKSKNKKIKFLAPDQLSFMESFKNMAKSDWHNGAAILSCHAEKEIKSDLDHMPLNKLSIKGFEFLDPFMPIEVPRLTEKEMMNLLDFYRSKNWLVTSEGDMELKALSAGSISTLRNLCGFFY